MSKFKILFVVTLWFLLMGCVNSNSNPENVSIFSLITTPNKFNKKEVKFTAYFNKKGKNSYSLYPYKEDTYIEDPRREIIIDNYQNPIDFSKCAEKYVAIVGTFEKGAGSNNILMFYNIQSINVYDDKNKLAGYKKYNNICYRKGDQSQ